MVSTAGRVIIDVTYAAGSPPNLPRNLVVKLARGVDKIMAPFYANEVAFYRRIRPELELEAPKTLGGDFDPESTNFALVLENLTARDARSSEERRVGKACVSTCRSRWLRYH